MVSKLRLFAAFCGFVPLEAGRLRPWLLIGLALAAGACGGGEFGGPTGPSIPILSPGTPGTGIPPRPEEPLPPPDPVPFPTEPLRLNDGQGRPGPVRIRLLPEPWRPPFGSAITGGGGIFNMCANNGCFNFGFEACVDPEPSTPVPNNWQDMWIKMVWSVDGKTPKFLSPDGGIVGEGILEVPRGSCSSLVRGPDRGSLIFGSSGKGFDEYKYLIFAARYWDSEHFPKGGAVFLWDDRTFRVAVYTGYHPLR